MLVALLTLSLAATPMEEARTALRCNAAGAHCSRPGVKPEFVITNFVELERQLFVGVARSHQAWGQSIEAVLEFAIRRDGSVVFTRCHERHQHDSRLRFAGYEVSLCSGEPRAPELPVAPPLNPRGVVGPHDWHHPLVQQEYAMLDAVLARAPSHPRFLNPDTLFPKTRYAKPDGGFRQVAMAPPSTSMKTAATVVFELTADFQVISAACWSRLPENGQHVATLQLAPIATNDLSLTFEDSCEETEHSRDLVTYDVERDGTVSFVSRATTAKN